MESPVLKHLQRFDWTFSALAMWIMSGVYLDGWAHTHGKVDSSFFTPWHAVLYFGYGVLVAFLVVQVIRSMAHGRPWRQALPVGYGWSMGGALLFWFAGLGDLLWHSLVGVEKNVEATFSPPHLVLFGGLWLIVSGPFRAAWHRDAHPCGGFWPLLPVLLSMTLLVSIVTIMTASTHPITRLWGGGQAPLQFIGLHQNIGITGFLWHTVLLMGAVLVLMERWILPPGALTLLITLNAVGMGFLRNDQPFPIVPVVSRMVAAVLGDLLYARLKPSARRPLALRLFAFTLPALLTTMHFVALQMTQGLWWTPHLWAGMILLSGLAGVLCSYLRVPPKQRVWAATLETVP